MGKATRLDIGFLEAGLLGVEFQGSVVVLKALLELSDNIETRPTRQQCVDMLRIQLYHNRQVLNRHLHITNLLIRTTHQIVRTHILTVDLQYPITVLDRLVVEPLLHVR